MGLIGDVIAIAVVGLICLSAGGLVRAPDEFYFPGLRAGVAAALGMTLTATGLAAAAPSTPMWILLVVCAPLIEETCRVRWAAHARGVLTTPRAWRFFALGYASFETILKYIDLLFSGAWRFWAWVAPLGSFYLHVFVGVLVCWLLSKRWPPLSVFAIAFAIHAANNGAVVIQLGGFGLLVQIFGFSLLAKAVLTVGERDARMTTASAHANTPS